jgi:hypothetical protein
MVAGYREIAEIKEFRGCGGGFEPPVGVDLADAIVIAYCRNSIAIRGGRLVADKVIALIHSEDEERVLAVDSVRRQAVKELLKRDVIAV